MPANRKPAKRPSARAPTNGANPLPIEDPLSRVYSEIRENNRYAEIRRQLSIKAATATAKHLKERDRMFDALATRRPSDALLPGSRKKA